MKTQVWISPVYGVPINTREALGVLHFKGFIIDDSVLYSGASLNDVYLHQHDKYRYDRYQCIRNGKMADVMFDWVDNNLVQGRGVNRLDRPDRPKKPGNQKRHSPVPSGAPRPQLPFCRHRW